MHLILLLLIALSVACSSLGRTLKQHVARSIVDDCGNVNGELTVDNPSTRKPSKVGPINSCLCISGLPSYAKSNAVCVAGVSLAGADPVISALSSLVYGAKDHKTCYYPDHAVPFCSPKNPCDFTCKDGFTATPSGDFPSSCVCKYPNTICNGVCGFFRSCPSAKPYYKRDANQWQTANCNEGWSACGVFGGSRRAWECIDTMSDLESCGGCAIPLHITAPRGVDCTLIPGVSDVSCLQGSCAVHSCKRGWAVSPDGSSCIQSHTDRVGPYNGHELSAADYGLQHVPLQV